MARARKGERVSVTQPQTRNKHVSIKSGFYGRVFVYGDIHNLNKEEK